MTCSSVSDSWAMSLRTELEAASQASATILALSVFSSTPSTLSTRALFLMSNSLLGIPSWSRTPLSSSGHTSSSTAPQKSRSYLSLLPAAAWWRASRGRRHREGYEKLESLSFHWNNCFRSRMRPLRLHQQSEMSLGKPKELYRLWAEVFLPPWEDILL